MRISDWISHVCSSDLIFGPFASLMRFDTDEQAYRIANDSRFGLVGYAWSRDIDRILTAQDRIAAGTIWCNTPMMLDLHAPVGGIRESGFGAQCGPASDAVYTHQKLVLLPRKRLNLPKPDHYP